MKQAIASRFSMPPPLKYTKPENRLLSPSKNPYKPFIARPLPERSAHKIVVNDNRDKSEAKLHKDIGKLFSSSTSHKSKAHSPSSNSRDYPQSLRRVRPFKSIKAESEVRIG